MGDRTGLELAETPFVDNFGVACVVEKARSNPRLRNRHCQTFHLKDSPTEGAARVIEKEEKRCTPLYK